MHICPTHNLKFQRRLKKFPFVPPCHRANLRRALWTEEYSHSRGRSRSARDKNVKDDLVAGAFHILSHVPNHGSRGTQTIPTGWSKAWESSSLEAPNRSASVVGVQPWKRVSARRLLSSMSSTISKASHGTLFPDSSNRRNTYSHDRENPSDFRGNRFPDRLGEQSGKAGRTPYRFTPCALSSFEMAVRVRER